MRLRFRILNVLNANETFVWLVNTFDASYIAHYSLKWLCPLHRILSLKWIWPAVSETKTETETKPTQRSQIKICEKRQTQNVQFRFMPNAFRILKPIQKSSKRVWVFRNTGANAFAKNQMRLAYEDKRDLYCTLPINMDIMLRSEQAVT